ncbi:Mu transposase C-terminal domain-containing protein [Pseudorhodoferax sp. LjRoot39]|uniref:Mu transposase C-terminal domain-containing protein n=1 Tax=Pseudorhodoferax sp. LjRoot39 TaxID=3342328 RepID=UPI003ECEAB60
MGSTDLVEKYFRRISPEVEPSRHAVWTLELFDKNFEKYLNEVYHPNHHTTLGMSPDAAWALGLRSHGKREHREIPYNAAFIVASCPAVRKGTARVTPAGIKINYRWFKCPELQVPGVLGTNVEARYDPFNAGIAYAYVGGQWHTCYSELHAVFSTYSERAVWLATESMKLKDRAAGKQLAITAERLALFMHARELEEDVARQVRHDVEAATHRRKIEQTDSDAASLPHGQAPATQPVVSSLPRHTTNGDGAAIPVRRRSVRVLEDL